MYLIPIFAILNRLRGASGFPASIHGLAFSLYMYYISNNIWVAILTQIGYEIGERQSWGVALGFVSSTTSTRISKDVHSFHAPAWKPAYWMSVISGKLAPEWWTSYEQSLKYARVFLILRGAFWFGLTFLPAAVFGVISVASFLLITAFLGVAFSISADLDRETKDIRPTWMYKNDGWSFTEVVYGAFQGLAIHLFLNLL